MRSLLILAALAPVYLVLALLIGMAVAKRLKARRDLAPCGVEDCDHEEPQRLTRTGPGGP